MFHGKGFVKSYYEQQEETKPYIQWFIDERLEKWLLRLEACLRVNRNGTGCAVRCTDLHAWKQYGSRFECVVGSWSVTS